MFCKFCGAKISEGERFCSHCGARLDSNSSAPSPNQGMQGSDGVPFGSQGGEGAQGSSFGQQPNSYSPYPNQQNNGARFSQYNSGNYQPPYEDDSSGCLFGGLSFMFWYVGIILFILWREKRPRTAKACLTGALISLGLSAFFIIISIIMNLGLGSIDYSSVQLLSYLF